MLSINIDETMNEIGKMWKIIYSVIGHMTPAIQARYTVTWYRKYLALLNGVMLFLHALLCGCMLVNTATKLFIYCGGMVPYFNCEYKCV